MTSSTRVKADLVESLWNFFASVKLTIVLLFSLALAASIGTFIPQNAGAEEYLRHFGPFWYQMFSVLDIFDMYHAWWFQLLILFLVLNIIVCSVERLEKTWKIIFNPNPKPDARRILAGKNRQQFDVDGDARQIRKRLEGFFAKRFRHLRIEDRGDGRFLLTAEKGRWTRLGVYVVHFSVVLLLAGGLIGSIFGFDGFISIPEGQSADHVRLVNSNRTLTLPFSIRCDDFSISFYDNGAVREYRSKLSLLRDGKIVYKKDIIVNDPLRYEGINIFQASYGKTKVPGQGKLPGRENLPAKIDLEISSMNSAMVYQRQAGLGQSITLPEGGDSLVLERFEPQASFGGQVIGPAFVARLTQAEGHQAEILLPVNFPGFDRMRRGKLAIAIGPDTRKALEGFTRVKEIYYTGLQVSRDPGVPVVYSGFILIVAGCFITFFLSHQQVAVEVAPEQGRSKIIIAGKANKNKMGFKARIRLLAKALESSLNQPL